MSAPFVAATPPEGLRAEYEQREKQDAVGRDWKFAERGAERLIGMPPPRKWLVEPSIPLGAPALVASMGGVGKSFLMLQLCLRVIFPPVGGLDFARPVMGGRIAAHGSAVFLTSEDDIDEVHRRLHELDPEDRRANFPGKLIIIAIPSEPEGSTPLFVKSAFGGGPVTTTDWDSFCDACAAMPDLKVIVIDPLAAVCALALDSDSADAAFVTTQFGRLAARTGATVIACHHMRKSSKDGAPPADAAEARERIRGSSGIVDGVRCAYALWSAPEDDARRICKTMEIDFTPKRVVFGAVVKTNGPDSEKITTYIRTDQGLLLDRTADLAVRNRPAMEDAADKLVAAVGEAAERGSPFTLSGGSGLHVNRDRLPAPLCTWGRDKLEDLCRKMLDEKRITRCLARGTTYGKWLDVPGGDFAEGRGEFMVGSVDG